MTNKRIRPSIPREYNYLDRLGYLQQAKLADEDDVKNKEQELGMRRIVDLRNQKLGWLERIAKGGE